MARLRDAALQDFIVRGYRVVQPTATTDLHGELHRPSPPRLGRSPQASPLVRHYFVVHALLRSYL